MTNSNFTPGPWFAVRKAAGGFEVNVKDSEYAQSVAIGVGPWLGYAPGDPEANAHLIAAAPDLYAALAFCADELEAEVSSRWRDDHGEHPDVKTRYERDMEPVVQARAALAKAEGGAR